ncbi:hypothetical protein [Maricaulis sp.]|nr:hypothetical protein [Maricaulis sp.]
MGLRKAAAARALGVARGTVDAWLQNGVPKLAALACAALAFDLPPWRPS